MSEQSFKEKAEAIKTITELAVMAGMMNEERVKNSVKACVFMSDQALNDLANIPGGVRTFKEFTFESLEALKNLEVWASSRTDEAISGNAGKETSDHPITIARNITKNFNSLNK